MSDTAYPGAECHKVSNGTECGGNPPPPDAQTITVRILDSYDVSSHIGTTDFRHFEPVPVVVLGHAGDARHLQCPSEVRDACRKTFVVDTVAWSNGQSWPVELPDDPSALSHQMTIDEVETAAAGPLLMATVVQGKDVQAIDPRLHVVGTDTYWVVRALTGEIDHDAGAAAVEAIDDATGTVVARTALDVATSYMSGLVRTQATDTAECCPGGDAQPMYSIIAAGGTTIQEALIGGSFLTGDNDVTRWMAGPGAVLEPGSYQLKGWHAQIAEPGGVWGVPEDECTTAIEVANGDDLRLEAAFPAQGACEWRSPTFSDTLY